LRQTPEKAANTPPFTHLYPLSTPPLPAQRSMDSWHQGFRPGPH
jgi:hypothetical protein